MKKITALILALALAMSLAILSGCDSSDYKKAMSLYDNGQYEEAEAIFKELGEYENSREMVSECQYNEAIALYDAGDYEGAIQGFKNAGGIRAAERLNDAYYMQGKEYLANGEYEKAESSFKNAQDYEDAAAYASYALGMKEMGNESYKAAQEAFEAAGDVEKTAEMLNASKLMQAEGFWEDGYLNSAKELYESLPEGYTYNGVNAADRLAKLEQFKGFVALCGQWKCNSMNASVRQTHTSTGLWDQWDGESSGYLLDVTCVINEDDTATLTAKAGFWHYTNYSSLSKYLKTTTDSVTFTYTGTKVPAKMDYYLDFTYTYSGTLTISGQTFKLNYVITDRNSSMNFDYTYKSYGTYDTLVKAY